VQSEKPSAFNEEDIAVLNTMADQVAIAIENARLFSETRDTLTELQTLHGQYLEQQWSRTVIEAGKGGYQYAHGRLEPLPAQAAAHLWSNLAGGEPAVVDMPADDAGGSSSSNLVAPILVRGQVIGVYNLGEPEQPGGWKKEDIEFVKSVADQVGLALENARLLEQTQKRAEREHLVAEITGKMRSSNDPKEILETAKRELLQALGAKRADISDSSEVAKPAAADKPPEGVNSNGHKTTNETKDESGEPGAGGEA
jgi:GAF domain-containing protein